LRGPVSDIPSLLLYCLKFLTWRWSLQVKYFPLQVNVTVWLGLSSTPVSSEMSQETGDLDIKRPFLPGVQRPVGKLSHVHMWLPDKAE
jgi:hypothetical protein